MALSRSGVPSDMRDTAGRGSMRASKFGSKKKGILHEIRSVLQELSSNTHDTLKQKVESSDRKMRRRNLTDSLNHDE